jgi:hypothetical protein
MGQKIVAEFVRLRSVELRRARRDSRAQSDRWRILASRAIALRRRQETWLYRNLGRGTSSFLTISAKRDSFVPRQGFASMDFASTYPRELAKRIVSCWPVTDDPLDSLPPEEAVVALVSEAFLASLLREEGRPVTCRLCSSSGSATASRS